MQDLFPDNDDFPLVEDDDWMNAFDHYQDQCASEFAFYPGMLLYPALGLASEASEVAGKVKKLIRDDAMPLDEGFDTRKIDAEKMLRNARFVWRNKSILSPWQDTLIEFGYIRSF